MAVHIDPETGVVDIAKLGKDPFIKSTDMPPELSQEVQEVVTMAIDKYASSNNFEVRVLHL